MQSVKLDLGAGPVSPPGFRPMGDDHATPIYPLPYPDESVDEIRAAHVLEHFPKAVVPRVVADWTRALKKGGRLKIAVPDFAKIAEGYVSGQAARHEDYLMGGQTAANDFHHSVFDRDRLRKLLAGAGLVLLRPWQSELDDCAAMPVSLNLEGRKPHVPEIRVSGAMSVPRLGFMDNLFCAIEAVIPCQVKFRKHGGAYWGQSLTHVMERILEEDESDCILTVDYDSIFSPKNLADMMQLMMLYPEIDALAPIQSSRHLKSALFTARIDPAAPNRAVVTRDEMQPDTMPVATAHFGMTLIRTAKLRALPLPWFHSVPSKDGRWKIDDGHIDEDIQFWRKWEAAGNSLHLANRVAIGHAELMVRWPDVNLEVFYQSMTEWQNDGAPEAVWK